MPEGLPPHCHIIASCAAAPAVESTAGNKLMLIWRSDLLKLQGAVACEKVFPAPVDAGNERRS